MRFDPKPEPARPSLPANDDDILRPPGDYEEERKDSPVLISHFSEVRKKGDREFLFAHKTDETKNFTVTIQGEGENFEWIGLPQAWQSVLDSRFERQF